MSVARFIADQRTNYRVPHTMTCALLGVSLSWFYKGLNRTPTPTEQWRAELDAAVATAFRAARGLHGSPRLHDDLGEAGWTVSEKTVADSMRRQGLVARKIRRRNGLTRQDKTAPKFPDLIRRDFTATAPNSRWVGDMTEIPTAAGKLYLATVIDCYSKAVIGYAMADHMRTSLVTDALDMARTNTDLAVGCIFHSDRGSQYTSTDFANYLSEHDMRGSMGRTGVCWDNAMAESFFASLKNEFVYRTAFPTRRKAIDSIAHWIEIRYNRKRLHSGIGYRTPWDVHCSYVPGNRAA